MGAEQAKVFAEHYGVTETGNFEGNKTILNVVATPEELGKRFKKDVGDIRSVIAEARSRLLEHRAKRIRPHRDDKVIAGWDGLIISSLAYGGAVLGEQRYVVAAEKAAGFVLSELRQDGRLMRYYRDGKVVGPGFLDDYAFVTMGLLDLYEATFDAKWVAEAREVAEEMIEQFSDEKAGGFYLSGRDGERLIVRNRPGYDGAVPSGNSIAALVLLKLGRLTMDRRFTDQGKQAVEAFSGRLVQSPASLTAMLVALDFWLGPTQEIVIAGDPKGADTEDMLGLLRRKFLPRAVVLFHGTGEAGQAIEKQVPFVKGQIAIGGKATAYVCENYVCRKPVTSVRELDGLLDAVVRGGGSGSQPASTKRIDGANRG
ncbi:MAG: thioredoxin domain-containing protein [Planctomycetota bacterium]